MGNRVRVSSLVVLVILLLFGVSGQAFGDWPTWLDGVRIVPENPTSSDIVEITLYGEWHNSCRPNASAIQVVGNDIYFDVIWNYPPDVICLMVIVGWGRTESVGPLAPGTYDVYTRLIRSPVLPPKSPIWAPIWADPLGYVLVDQFVVTDGPPGPGPGEQAEPIAHWKLDEVEGVIAEDLAGTNDGTLVNGPVWTAGQVNGALEFDGEDDYVDLGSTVADGLGRGSFTAWVYPADLSAVCGIRNFAYIIGADEYWGGELGIRVDGDGSGWAAVNNRAGGSEPHIAFPEGTFEVGSWHHVALTWDGSYWKLYINGSIVGQAANSAGTTSATNTTTLGKGWDGCPWNGVIDDARFYNRALSAEEIGILYGGEFIGLEITGPDEVAENSQAQYKATASYERIDIDVTDLADWSVEPNDNCGIAAGLLTTGVMDLPQDVTITVQYNEDENIREAQKDVFVYPICPSGSALEFDGVDDYVDIADSDVFTLNEAYTLSAWIKSDSTRDQKIVNQWGAGGVGNASWILIIENAKIRIGNHDGVRSNYVSGNTELQVDQWYHVAGVWDGSSGFIYINGDLDNSASLSRVPQNSGYPVRIGRGAYASATSPDYFDGVIDEVCIFNRALSAEEIQVLMNFKADADDPSLVAYWDLDEGEGQVAYDTSGNGNDGVLGSTPDIDDNDPNWTDSVPPAGICSLEGIVERNLLKVLGLKTDVLDILDEAIGKEQALWEYMDIVFKNRDFGNTSRGDVAKAKQKIMGAIQNEEQAETSVDQSIEKLDDAMNTLGLEQQ